MRLPELASDAGLKNMNIPVEWAQSKHLRVGGKSVTTYCGCVWNLQAECNIRSWLLPTSRHTRIVFSVTSSCHRC
jgi:hypothetical protein